MMMAGCLLFVPAAGITTVQVVANPLIALLGAPATAHSRLTFAQAFNSLGTTIFPYVGSILILGSLGHVDPSRLSAAALGAFHSAETRVIEHTYLGLAIALLIVAALVWLHRDRLREAKASPNRMLEAFTLLKEPRFAFGAHFLRIFSPGKVLAFVAIVPPVTWAHGGYREPESRARGADGEAPRTVLLMRRNNPAVRTGRRTHESPLASYHCHNRFLGCAPWL